MSIGMHTSDHELKIGSTTKKFKIIRDDSGKALYDVYEEVPNYQEPLRFFMNDWQGCHGQHDFRAEDVWFDGQSIDTFQEGKIFLGPLIYSVGAPLGANLDAAPTAFCWFAAIGKLMVATTEQVYWYDGTDFVTKKTFSGLTITDLIEFNGILYVALAGSNRYYYSATGDTDSYVQTDLTDGYAKKFFNSPNAAGTANVLWKADSRAGYNNQVSSTTDGRTVAGGGAQWTSAAYLGDKSNDIVNIFLVNDNLLIGRTDALFHYDADGGIHSLMGDLKHNRSTNNFKYVTEWQTAAYFSLGTGLGEITAYDAFEPMGPLTKIGDLGKSGVCVGLSSDKDFIYTVMDEGVNSHVYKGRERRTKDGLRWEWCPWVFLGTNACATAKVVQHSATDRRLWFGYGSVNAAYVKIFDNPLAEATQSHCPAGWIRFSYEYGTNPYWDMLFQSIVTETLACAAGQKVTPRYRKDATTIKSGAADATEALQLHDADGAFVAADVGEWVWNTTDATYAKITTLVDSGQVTLDTDIFESGDLWVISMNNLTAAITTNGVVKTNLLAELTCKRIQFQLDLATTASTATPIVTHFEARGIEKPETVRYHEVTYAVGTQPSSTSKSIRSFLRGGRSSTSLIKLADLRYGETTEMGTDYVWVILEPGFPKEIEILHAKNQSPELGIQCKFREVSWTIA